jgi:chromosome segregation ATPase
LKGRKKLKRRTFEILALTSVLLVGCASRNVRTERGNGPTGATQQEAAAKTGHERNVGGPEVRGVQQAGNPTGEAKTARAQTEANAERRSSRRIRDEVAFNSGRAALTESLSEAKKRIETQDKEINRLKEAVRESEAEVSQLKGERDRLQQDLAEHKKRVESLKKALSEWKENVLGYRDEMRAAEKSEMEALKQIIMLLRKAGRSENDSKEKKTATKGDK